ncbi:MAG: ferredoxin [Marivirga sp.]|nr:ferredoxin [Marivirga sp.]
MITFHVEDHQGTQKKVEVPEGISLSLMEVLKASDYSILATCGGMALCATCHVEVKNGSEKLLPPSDLELDMLDTLPNADNFSRLACQIRIEERLQGALFSIREPHTD